MSGPIKLGGNFPQEVHTSVVSTELAIITFTVLPSALGGCQILSRWAQAKGFLFIQCPDTCLEKLVLTKISGTDLCLPLTVAEQHCVGSVPVTP